MTSKKMPPGQAAELAKGMTEIILRNYGESKIDLLLEKLEGVRSTGQNRWLSKCPAHNDRSPSLAIRETDDGRILVHCFSGCSAHEILSSIGLEFSDLFPEPLDHHRPRERKPFPSNDVLRCISFETIVISSAAATLLDGRPFSEADRERLILAASRIQAAAGLAGVTP